MEAVITVAAGHAQRTHRRLNEMIRTRFNYRCDHCMTEFKEGVALGMVDVVYLCLHCFATEEEYQ